MAEVKDENGRKERFFLFYDGESVTGKVSIIHLPKDPFNLKNPGECHITSQDREDRAQWD